MVALTQIAALVGTPKVIIGVKGLKTVVDVVTGNYGKAKNRD